jgi:hypothetical protein
MLIQYRNLSPRLNQFGTQTGRSGAKRVLYIVANDQTAPWPAGISTSDMPLPQRWYRYRGRILRTQKQMAHSGDLLYDQIVAAKKAILPIIDTSDG